MLSILTHGDSQPTVNKEILMNQALAQFNGLVEFEEGGSNSFSIIKVTTNEPKFSKSLAEQVILELEKLNRFFKSQTVGEKINFIENRINAVSNELEYAELNLKAFNEKNRQVSSPSLKLELERLTRDVEIQKGIYLTLKQQLELAKIEEIGDASVIQVLDRPTVATYPSNKNLKFSLILSTIFGLMLGIFLSLFRAYLNTDNAKEKAKLNTIKKDFKSKAKDLFFDARITGSLSLILLIASPYYLTYESKNPVFFGLYSHKLLIINITYVLIFFLSFISFVYVTLIKKRKFLKNKIKLIVYDFDGVMTNNRAIIDENGKEFVEINRSDGLGIEEIKKLNIQQIILSSEKNSIVSTRAKS